MTTIDLFVDDSDIDVAIDDRDEGERRAMELAHRIRVVAAHDPGQAQRLVDELIVQLDRVLGGTFLQYLDGVTREVADRALREAGSESSAVFPQPGNS